VTPTGPEIFNTAPTYFSTVLESIVMSSQRDSTDGSSALERFLSGGRIDPENLGEPPLANTEDSLLDRERIHVEPDTDEE